MVTGRPRNTASNSIDLPRRGLLLLVLAIGIVIYSRNAQVPVGVPVAPTPASDSQLAADLQVQSHEVSAALPSSEDTSEKLPETVQSPGETASSESLEKALGPTEFDGQMLDQLSLISDNTFGINKREMPAYWALIRRCANTPFEDLLNSAESQVRFHDLYSRPDKNRGKLCSLEVVARRVTRFPAEAGNPAGVDSVYEIWGTTFQSQAWMYVFVTDKLPEGHTEKSLIGAQVKIVGYFLKVMSYQPGNAALNAKPLAAPLLISKVDANPVKKVIVNTPTTGPSVLSLLAIGLVVIALATIVLRLRTAKAPVVDSKSTNDWSWIEPPNES